MDNAVRKLLHFFLYISVFFIFTTCKEDKWIEWKIMNTAWLDRHLELDTNIEVTSSGLQYRIIADPNPTEARPNSDSYVICTYQLRLIDGTIVQDRTNAQIYLPQAISGFTEGIRKIHTHGDIQLWIPYSIGYGSSAVGSEGYSSFIPSLLRKRFPAFIKMPT